MIAIVDDEKAARDELEFLVNKYFNNSEIIKLNSGTDFINFKEKEKISIIFLDIHLGDIDGLLIAKMIKEMANDTIIVLVSAYDKYALKSYEIGIFDYITKPIIESRFENLVYRIKKETNVLKKGSISLTSGRTTFVINVEDIVYIEYIERKIVVHTNEKKEYMSSLSLNKLLSMLPDDLFFRAHKSYVVNIKYIDSIEQAYSSYYDINLKGFSRIKIPVSRNKTKELKLILNTN